MITQAMLSEIGFQLTVCMNRPDTSMCGLSCRTSIQALQVLVERPYVLHTAFQVLCTYPIVFFFFLPMCECDMHFFYLSENVMARIQLN